MFDTMTFTKVLGGLCGALLVFLLGQWLAESIYHTGGGHGEAQELAYSVDTGEAEGEAGGAEGEQVDFNALLAAADPAAGEKVFGKCKACHHIDGSNATGPHLDGVVNRQKASVPDFTYSDTLTGMQSESWTPDNLNHFLENPKSYAPGTKMSFAGLKKPEDRADIVAFLQSLGG
jgi:cytochrome c